MDARKHFIIDRIENYSSGKRGPSICFDFARSPRSLDPECILKLLLRNISAAPDRLD